MSDKSLVRFIVEQFLYKSLIIKTINLVFITSVMNKIPLVMNTNVMHHCPLVINRKCVKYLCYGFLMKEATVVRSEISVIHNPNSVY